MKHVYYKVAHREQAEIDSFKNRYKLFKADLIPDIFKQSLNLKVTEYHPSASWGTSHVIFFVSVADQSAPLVLRANIGFGAIETVMLTEKLITDAVTKINVPTNHILYVDVSRKIYPFDFQIQKMLTGKDLENHFQGSQADYDHLSFELGQMIARVHTLTFPGFGLFNEEKTNKKQLVGIHRSFYDYILICLESDLTYLREAQVISNSQLDQIVKLFLDYKPIINIRQGVLVHHDLADHNIMYEHGKITGIFDWEAAVVGDSVLDLASCPTWKTFYPRKEKLIAGYKSVSDLPEHFEEKMKIYTLRTMLWKMVFAIRMGILNDTRKNKFYEALAPFKL